MILSMRTPSGISGDMFLTGLSCFVPDSKKILADMLAMLGLTDKDIRIETGPHSVNHIAGWQTQINLPHEHSHRTFADIKQMIDQTDLSQNAKSKAIQAFSILAQAEAKVHQKTVDQVIFHEVGALDSIVDIVASSVLLDALAADQLVCSPLPLADGSIYMQHGHLFSPAPAVLEMLEQIPVYGVYPEGETVTPTGLALLKAWEFEFGYWPTMIVQQSVVAYGHKVFKNLPNGAVFTLGEKWTKQ